MIATIGIDNQAVLQAFGGDLNKPAHHIAREILRQTNILSKPKKKNRKNQTLTLCWTAGHEGIEGNEKADKEAKRASEGHTTEKSILPRYLRRTLTLNPSAIKQKQKSDLKRWQNYWKISTRGPLS